MTTLPNLTPCPKPDCRAPITHWHDGVGDALACSFVMRGKPCLHGAGSPLRCYAPRETAPTSPLHQPDRETLAKAIYESDYTLPEWYDESEGFRDVYRANAQAVLDALAAHQPVWVEVPKGTLIKAGTRYRRGAPDGPTYESIAGCDFLSGDGITFVDPRTVPAPTLTERIRAAANDSPEGTITLDVADVEALLDMAGGEDR